MIQTAAKAPVIAPYWLSACPARPWASPQPLPETCDVAIVGGGLTGLSAALHLARRGSQVHLLEQHDLGFGASTRNAGMTLAGLKHGPEALIGLYGREFACRMYRATLDAIDFTERFVQEESIACDFARHGALWAACTAGHFRGLAVTQRVLKEVFQHETFLISKAQLADELDSPRYEGGLVDPLSAGLHPGKLVSQLAARAEQSGARLHEQVNVTGISRTGDGFRIQTSKGVLHAKEVIAATNGYTPDHLSGLRRRVIPIGSYIVVTQTLGESRARALIPRGRMVFDTKHFLAYFRLTEDHRLLFGGRTSFAPIGEAEAAARLKTHMRTVFPGLHDAGVEYSWSGNVGFTFDQLPHLGIHNGIHFAMGYCGHGVANGLYFGHGLAKVLSGEPCDLPFWGMNFPAKIYYRRKPWFLPIAGAYYQLKDYLAR